MRVPTTTARISPAILWQVGEGREARQLQLEVRRSALRRESAWGAFIHLFVLLHAGVITVRSTAHVLSDGKRASSVCNMIG